MLSSDYTTNFDISYRYKANIKKSDVIILANIVVDRETENRIDLIAHLAYSDMSKYNIIAFFNDIADTSILPIGMVIEIPDYDSFMDSIEMVSYSDFNIQSQQNDISQVSISDNIKPNMKKSTRKNYVQNGSNFIF